MNRELLQILQHSLGVDQYGQGRQYRNHFCAGGDDVEKCEALCRLGFMFRQGPREISGGDPIYWVTDEGKAAMLKESPPPPKLSRSQKRYQAYLRVADCFESFGSYLKDLGRRMKGEEP